MSLVKAHCAPSPFQRRCHSSIIRHLVPDLSEDFMVIRDMSLHGPPGFKSELSSTLRATILSCWVGFLRWQELWDQTFFDKQIFEFSGLVHCMV
jgi:hypothetical protein